MFKDLCTKEWALNTTDVAAQRASANQACLAKEYPRAGVVVFKDVCTNEWAMNPPNQQ
jgi:hypothetical protein